MSMKRRPERGPAVELISIRQAAKRGLRRVRRSTWTNPKDHVEIPIFHDGMIGPWFKLWSPSNEIVGNSNPHMMICTQFEFDVEEWEIYNGPPAKGTQ